MCHFKAHILSSPESLTTFSFLILLKKFIWLHQVLAGLPRWCWLWRTGREDPLEKEIATCSSILAWEIPRTEEPGGLQSIGLQRVRHDWATKHTGLSCGMQNLVIPPGIKPMLRAWGAWNLSHWPTWEAPYHFHCCWGDFESMRGDTLASLGPLSEGRVWQSPRGAITAVWCEQEINLCCFCSGVHLPWLTGGLKHAASTGSAPIIFSHSSTHWDCSRDNSGPMWKVPCSHTERQPILVQVEGRGALSKCVCDVKKT